MGEPTSLGHLSEAQWLDLVSAAGDAVARKHLSDCADCVIELARLRTAFEEYKCAARQAADLPESHWLRQRTAVVSRATGRRAAPRFAWAAAVAAIFLAAVFFSRQAPPPSQTVATRDITTVPVRTTAPTQAPQADQDSALLVDVQRSLQREVPEALAPAALLVQEMNQTAEVRRNP